MPLYDVAVESSPEDWSPADNPYAIAATQAQLWRETVRLTVLRMRDEDDRRVGWSSRQLDAHVLVVMLRQLLTAEQLEQAALKALGIDQAVSAALTAARKQFEDALPGIKDMRDALMHFDEWAQGAGFGPQAERRNAGEALRDIARDYWRFGYDPITGVVSFGPYTIAIDAAERAASELCHAIWIAAHEVDKTNTAARRAKTIEALSRAGILYNTPDTMLRVSPGTDLRIWLSLDLHVGPDEQDRRQLSEKIVSALAAVGLALESTNLAETLDSVERLVRGEALCAVADGQDVADSASVPKSEAITEAQFVRTVQLAVDKFREAERCAEIECFEAACAMVGAAVESALIVQVCVFQSEVEAAGLWRKRWSRKNNTQEDKPIFDWVLEDLIQVAVKIGWLPTSEEVVQAAEPVEKLAGDVGDAVRFIQEVRNLIVHPGKYVRGAYWPTFGRDEYDVVYGIGRAVLDHLHAAVEKL
jgi:hypothetical protein